MKKIPIIIIILQLFSYISFSQSNNYNYVKSVNYFSEDTTRKVTSISYSDAFGRPTQDIVLGASPAGNDIVQTYRYDDLGRVEKSYLPFTNDGGQTGEFVDDALNLQTSFYNTVFPSQNAYSEVEYDNSPYNSIIKQSMPGEDINSVNISSGFTPAGGIDLWEVNNNQLIKNGSYPANSIMKFTGKDADNKKIYIYKDKTGKVLLKEAADGTVKTRYVYDGYGQLRYVLSPEAAGKMNGTYDMNSTLVKQYCYYYEYDNKHQLITKQLPGKEPVYLRYDSKYRLRMTQDGNQRQDDKWMFINYDYYGRTISTGLGNIDNDTIIQDTIMPPAEKGITAFLTYQYYDNYDFIENNNLNFDADLAYHDKCNRIRGKSTGSKVRVMCPDVEKWLTSVVYYDKYGRVIQAISQNYVGGYDIVSNKYNFAGELLETKHKHTKPTDGEPEPKFLVYLYGYDNMGRLLKVMLSQNADASDAIIINELTYNELGQVTEKKIHSTEGGQDSFLQTVDYGYNIKGAITNINDPTNLGEDMFGMNLYYDERIPDIYHTTYKDGKISAVQWNSKNLNEVKTYMYTYDDLNRLTNAAYSPGSKYNVNISYDLNGNIKTLKRAGEILEKTKASIEKPPSVVPVNEIIDDLTYTYNGNRLTSVSDAIGEIETQLNNDFRDVPSKIGFDEYYYDANGNMTKDLNKGINLVTYNHLNQPTVVDFGTKRTEYTYTATGLKLKTEVYEAGKLKTTTEYSGAYVYENEKLSFINIPGGRIVAKTDEYQYNLTDHLGNVRVTFKENASGNAEIIQEDHYYPFGMRMNGQHYTNTDLLNKFLYNGKELQEQTGWYSYGFRDYDPQLGRWHVIDAMAEKYYSHSSYAYVMNNPVSYSDIMGLMHYHEWDRPDRFHRNWNKDAGISWYGSGCSFGSLSSLVDHLMSTTSINGVGNWSSGGGYNFYNSLEEAQADGHLVPATANIYIHNPDGRWDGDSNSDGISDLTELQNKIEYAFEMAYGTLFTLIFSDTPFTSEDENYSTNDIYINIATADEYTDFTGYELLETSADGETPNYAPAWVNSNTGADRIAYAAIHETGHKITDIALMRFNNHWKNKRFGWVDRKMPIHDGVGLMSAGDSYWHIMTKGSAKSIYDYSIRLFQFQNRIPGPHEMYRGDLIANWFFMYP